jgi:thiamine-monophosphate kinase
LDSPTVESVGEFGLIDLLRRLSPSGRGVREGIGDDAAVLDAGKKGYFLLFATDAILENVHFLRSQGAERIGRKGLAVNLSDIAAMGGIPRWAVVNLGLPHRVPLSFVRGLYRGMAALARRHSVGIVGGDTVFSPGGIMLAVAVLGEVEKNRCVLRRGARRGDVVCVTGVLGEAAAGKHLDFTPRLQEARFLVERFSPTAMIDVSDGLFDDLKKLGAASGAGAVVREADLPLSPRAAKRRRAERLRAAAAGEEFELLFTLPAPELPRLLREFPRATGTSVAAIGEMVKGPRRFELVGRDGRVSPFPAGGYDHFGK